MSEQNPFISQNDDISGYQNASQQHKPASGSLAEEFAELYCHCYQSYFKDEYLPAYYACRTVFGTLLAAYFAAPRAESTDEKNLRRLVESAVLESSAKIDADILPLHQQMLQAAERGDYDTAINLCYLLVAALSDLTQLTQRQMAQAEQILSTLTPTGSMLES